MLNIQLGDRVTLSLAGEPRVAQVANTRSVRWDNLSPNFYLITNKPPQSEDAANWITSLYVPESQRLNLINHLKAYPNVTAIDVAQTIGTLRQLLNRLSQAVQLVWVLMLVAGLLVLLASVQASLPARRKEVALLRVAGASSNYITASVIGEFFFLGSMAAIAALICGEGILIWLQVKVFNLQLQSSILPWIFVPPSVGFLLACLGGLYCRSLAFISPASILREQS
jgi:putative ABC transport system permease protein